MSIYTTGTHPVTVGTSPCWVVSRAHSQTCSTTNSLRGKNKALPICFLQQHRCQHLCLRRAVPHPTNLPHITHTISGLASRASSGQSPLCHQHSKAIRPFFSSLSQKRSISEKPLPSTGNILRMPNGLIPFNQQLSNERFHSLSPNGLVSKIEAELPSLEMFLIIVE